MKWAFLALSLVAALAAPVVLPSTTRAACSAANGDPAPCTSTVGGSHHYATLSDGCDVVYSHRMPPPGRIDPNTSAFVLGTIGLCTSDDNARVDVCVLVLQSLISDELTGADMEAGQTCPLGDDQDPSGYDAFFNAVYRAYGLWIQGA